MFDMIYNLKLFPSGRTLWVGNSKSSYEYPLSILTVVSNYRFFEEVLRDVFVLMLGTGVGLS